MLLQSHHDAHDGSSTLLGLDARIESRLAAVSERVKLEDTGGTVPEDRLGGEDRLAEELARLRSGVEAHPSDGNSLSVGSVADLRGGERGELGTGGVERESHGGVLGELVARHVVDGEHELDVLGLGLRDELSDLCGAVLVEERVSNLDVLEGLLDRKSVV